MKKIYKFFIIIMIINTAQGENIPYQQCFIDAAKQYNVPYEILTAIAYVESRFKSVMGRTNTNGTYDIGVMQINSHWLPSLALLGINEKMLLENPCQNIYMGAWVLAHNFKTYGYNWTAIQRYNGPSSDLPYAKKVYARLQQIYPQLFQESNSQVKVIPMNMKYIKLRKDHVISKLKTTHKKQLREPTMAVID
ncbi:MAG: lytic transglycosylase domain-containing protein [Neisseriaceae bacterium]|jgi:soluble lytic murein transglycosylase-like protein